MKIIRLEHGQSAPFESDCINIDKLPSGRFDLTGSALCGGESVAIMDGLEFDDVAEAEAAGLAWADTNGVSELYVTWDAPGPGD